jgi:hypothetical protein
MQIDINTIEAEQTIENLIRDFLIDQPSGDQPIKAFIRFCYFMDESDGFTRSQLAFIATRFAFRYATGMDDRIRDFAGLTDGLEEINEQNN